MGLGLVCHCCTPSSQHGAVSGLKTPTATAAQGPRQAQRAGLDPAQLSSPCPGLLVTHLGALQSDGLGTSAGESSAGRGGKRMERKLAGKLPHPKQRWRPTLFGALQDTVSGPHKRLSSFPPLVELVMGGCSWAPSGLVARVRHNSAGLGQGERCILTHLQDQRAALSSKARHCFPRIFLFLCFIHCLVIPIEI